MSINTKTTNSEIVTGLAEIKKPSPNRISGNLTFLSKRNVRSSVKVRVLCKGGGGGGGERGGHAHVQSDITSTQSGHIRTQKNFYHL